MLCVFCTQKREITLKLFIRTFLFSTYLWYHSHISGHIDLLLLNSCIFILGLEKIAFGITYIYPCHLNTLHWLFQKFAVKGMKSKFFNRLGDASIYINGALLKKSLIEWIMFIFFRSVKLKRYARTKWIWKRQVPPASKEKEMDDISTFSVTV